MKIYENVKINKYKKLRDAIHDIITDLDKDQWLNIKDLSEELLKFNIRIPEEILIKIISSWKNKKDYTILEPTDIDWFFYDDKNNIVFNALNFSNPPSLGKSRERIKKEEKKKKKEDEKKRRIEIIDNVKKIESKHPIKCPIPTMVILDTFVNVDENDVLEIKEFIEKAIENNKINNLYEEAWDYMVKRIPVDLEYEIKKDTWLLHKLNTNKWVLPDYIDFDIKVRVWYYKYGKGSIDYMYGDYLTIDFDRIIPVKRINTKLAMSNKSIRIDKSYKKEPLKLEGFEYAYLKDLRIGNRIYHKKRGYGKVYQNLAYNNNIEFEFDGKIVRMTKRQFLKEQNILVEKKENKKILPYSNFYKKNDVENVDEYNYKITNPDDLKEGMKIKYNGLIYTISEHFKYAVELKRDDMQTFFRRISKLIEEGIYKKYDSSGNQMDF